MFHRRAEMNALGVTPAAKLAGIHSGKHVRIAGNVIVRQRPGTARGIVFLSIEDETGIANAVVMPDIFDAHRLLIVSERWLLVEGPIQNVDNVIHVRAKRIYNTLSSAQRNPLRSPRVGVYGMLPSSPLSSSTTGVTGLRGMAT